MAILTNLMYGAKIVASMPGASGLHGQTCDALDGSGRHASWRWLPLSAIIGAVWAGFGLLIMADASDGVTGWQTETFGYLLIIEGLVAALATMVSVLSGGRLLLIRALALIGLGLLIIDMPWRNDIANSLLFGLAFLIDGTARVAAALVLHHPRWKAIVLGGNYRIGVGSARVVELADQLDDKTVPFCIGVALLLSGVTILGGAFDLCCADCRPACRSRNCRCSPTVAGTLPSVPKPPSLTVETTERRLTIRVWEAYWVSEGPGSSPTHRTATSRRWILKGVISTGHAA